MLELLRISVKYIITAVIIACFIIAYSCFKVAGDADYKAMRIREKEGGLDR